MPTPDELHQIRQNVTENLEPRSSSNKLLVVVITVIVLLLIAASILNLLTPKQTLVRETTFVNTNVDDTKVRLTSVRFTGQEISVPEKLSLAQPITQSLKPEDVVNLITDRFDLVRTTPGIDQWQGNGYTLSKDKYLDTYTLVLTEFNGQQIPKLVGKDEAVQTAEKFIHDLVPNTSFSSLPDSIEFLLIEQETDVTTEDKATGLRVAFAPKINDIPVFYKKESRAAFTVIVDGSNHIWRTTFLPQFDTYQTTEEASSISIEQAIQNIMAGKASIINAQYLTEKLSLADLKDAELTSVSLEYREDPTQNLVYPFYRFKGKATTQTGLGVDLELITPAINTVSIRR